MRVGPRLLLAVLPSAIGVLLVAALAYWGDYQRQFPEALLVIAAAAVAASLIISWRNTRYVASRIQRLADAPAAPPRRASADELDVIEGVVDHLSSAVSIARAEGERRERETAERVEEYHVLLDALTGPIAAQLEQVQLPLHVLLASRFGDLNENQEEMIEAARRAADDADASVRRVKRILEMDRGEVGPATREPVHPTDLVQAARTIAAARAEERHVSLSIEVPRELPRVVGDRYRLEEALSAVLCAVVDRTPDTGSITVAGAEVGERLTLEVRHPGKTSPSLDMLLAARLIEAQQGALRDTDGRIEITLPAEHLRRAAPIR